MNTTTITTTSRRLAALLAPVLPLADKGNTLPILAAVLLRGHGEHGITATATDRYRIGVSRDEKIAAPEGFAAVVPVTALRQMLGLFRATKHHDPELSLEFVSDGLGGGVVHVATTSLGLDVEGARITYRLQPGEYPTGIEQVIVNAFDGAEPHTGPLAVNVRYLADFAAAGSPVEPTVFYVGKAGAKTQLRPIGVAVGENFRGAIMQVRLAEDSAPTGLDATWSAIISPPAKRPAAVTASKAATA